MSTIYALLWSTVDFTFTFTKVGGAYYQGGYDFISLLARLCKNYSTDFHKI